MTRLSVNINKIATLRNARGNNLPDLLQYALDIQKMGAQGITVHPRPDERHITYADVRLLKQHLTTELNIEGNPLHPPFMELVREVRPTQLTLVPDAAHALTSDSGWDCIKNETLLKTIVKEAREKGIRVSVFINAACEQVRAAQKIGADCIELYTAPYAQGFASEGIRTEAITPYIRCAAIAQEIGISLHAGHDLNLDNIAFLKQSIPFIREVSIGHALICEALYKGLSATIQQYLKLLR